MSAQDRQRWNDKYARGDHSATEPSRLITALDRLLPRSGFALDVAGGAGRHALWLAERGLSVTLTDISAEALRLARNRSDLADLPLRTLQVDFEEEPFPIGPWDLILCVHYLWRPLFHEFKKQLTQNGLLVFLQPTFTNLQRHGKPSARFLLEDLELRDLAGDFQIVHYDEGWLEEGRHEAILVARQLA